MTFNPVRSDSYVYIVNNEKWNPLIILYIQVRVLRNPLNSS